AVMAGGRFLDVAPPASLGGREQELATVSWTDPDGTPRSTTSAEPTRTVTELAGRFDGEVPGLSVTRPTLEETYLRMVGEA
ncbi:MAG TPA: ABC transporter ATP-binding protein, partial [Actinomycetes bacterium]|nr:ABC transporter ATP-binding protein [Actinomycetes bacterium]